MAELSLRERLQPALLDRLIDEERRLVLYEIQVTRAELKRLGIAERDFLEILAAQGLQRDASAAPAGGTAADVLHLRFFAPYARTSLSQLKSLVLKPPAAPQGVALQSFCTIEGHTVTNDTPESGERRFASMRRLREYVCRDLAWLLNSTGIDETVDLSRYPEVQRSVVNYGMPSLAGRAAVAIDVERTARAIEEVIRRFEPRLTRVRVAPDTEGARRDGHQLAFRIEADLWGQPAPQHLVLRTRISTESGDVSVADSGAR
jgi:type VI secretion system protein ImpF